MKHKLKRFLIQPFFFLLFVPALCAFFETTSGLNKKGNEQFKEKHYDTALEIYQKAEVRSPDVPEVRYNLGTTFYQLDRFKEGEAQLKKALDQAQSKELKATAWYNYGNTQYRLGQFDEAI